jgi:hypothetical protein
MEGLTIIEGKTLEHWDLRFANLEQAVLSLAKMVKQLLPALPTHSVPDFIAISDACKKYHISRQTINNKIKLFKKLRKRDIDRLQSGNFFLINEAELQEAIRLKGHYTPPKK